MEKKRVQISASAWGHTTPAEFSREWSLVEQRNLPVGLGWVGVASKAVCLLGGHDSGFVRSSVVSFIDVVKGWRRDVRSAHAAAHRA